jgi:hypothetical protein
LYSSGELGRVCSTHQRDDKCVHNFSQKLKGGKKKYLAEVGIKWEENIKMDLKEIICEDVN